MKSIALIIPWFGPFHNYFDLWLESAGYNTTVDFFIITDNKCPENCPKNVRFVSMSFDAVKQRLQDQVDFKIKLTTYKLCDFKPLYMLAFYDIIKDYDFCGYCDVDLIFGDIRTFLTDEVLENERVLQRGHFSIYQNNEKMRTLYKRTAESDNIAYSYRKAWKTNYSCYFDEFLAMDIVTDIYCTTVKDQRVENIVLDPPAHIYEFISESVGKHYFCIWENGHLYRQFYGATPHCLDGEKTEFMYIHLQKRKISREKIGPNQQYYYIVPNKFIINLDFSITKEEAASYTRKHFANDKKKNIKKLMKFGPIDCIQHRLRRRKIDKWLAENKPDF